MAAMTYQFHAQHARVRELITDGADGAVGEVRGLNVSLTFDPGKSLSDSRHGSLETGGNSLYDRGCYCIHVIRGLRGEPDRAATVARFAGPQRGGNVGRRRAWL